MNSKSSEQHEGSSISKKSKKEKSRNPDVLIIPPNLLEKFGFMLGSIPALNDNDAQDGSKINNETSNLKYHNTKSSEDQSIIVNDEHIMNLNKKMSNKDTSILETASLMKESVFLSPTFVPTVASALPGELEITSVSEKVCNMNQIELDQTQKDVETVSAHDTKLSSERNHSKNQLSEKRVYEIDCLDKSIAPQENLEQENITLPLLNIHNISFNSCDEVMNEDIIVQSDQVIDSIGLHDNIQPSNDNFLRRVEDKTSVEHLDSIDISIEKNKIEHSLECVEPKIDIVSQPIDTTACNSQIKAINNRKFEKNIYNDGVIKKMYQKHEVNSCGDVIAKDETNLQYVKSNEDHGPPVIIFGLNETEGNVLLPFVQSNKDEESPENILVSGVHFDENLINSKSEDTSSETKNTCQNENVAEEKHWECAHSKESHGSLDKISIISVSNDGSLMNFEPGDTSNTIKNIDENEIARPEKHLQCLQTNEDQETPVNVLAKDFSFDGNTTNIKSVGNFTKITGEKVIVGEKSILQYVQSNEKDQVALKNIPAASVLFDGNLKSVQSANERLGEEKHIEYLQSYEDQGTTDNILANEFSFHGNLINTKSIKIFDSTKNIVENETEEQNHLQYIQKNVEAELLDNITATSVPFVKDLINIKSVGNLNQFTINNVSKLMVEEEKHQTNEDQASLENTVITIPFTRHLTDINSVDNLNDIKNTDKSEITCKEKQLKLVQTNASQESPDNIISNDHFDEHIINVISVGNSYSDEKVMENECQEDIHVKGNITDCKKDEYLALNSRNYKINSESKSKKKIKIISEEIVNYKPLNDCKVTKASNVNNLIFVTMDSLISSKAKDNDKPVITTDKVKTTQCDVVIDNHSNELSHDLKINSSTCDNLLKSKPEALFNEICSLPSINGSTKIDEEFAVSDIYNENLPLNKSSQFIRSVENNTPTVRNMDSDKLNNNGSGNTATGSKQYSPQVLRKISVIEDIEVINKKCGDNIEFKSYSTCIKTYNPRRSNRHNKPVIHFKNQPEETVTLHNDNSITMNDSTHVDTTLDNTEYYFCQDFGKLIHCNLTDTEHIQLGQTDSECCDPNIIYEIYYDKTLLETQHCLDICENMDCENEIGNICWNDSNSNKILPDIDPLPTTSSAKENVNLIIKSDLKDKKGSCLLTQYNNFGNTDNPGKNTKSKVITVEDDKGSGNTPMIKVLTKINDNMNTISAIPAHNSVETAKDKNISESIKDQVNSATDASMLFVQNQYNNNNTLIHKNKFEMPKNKFTSPKKDYSSIGRGSKRNIDSVDSRSYECMEEKNCISRRNSLETPSKDIKRMKLGKVKCRMCDDVLNEEDWENHIYCKHLKWLNITKRKDLQSEEYHEHLNEKLKMVGILQCDFCPFRVNHVPTFVLHIENCIQTMSSKNRIVLSNQSPVKSDTCGVCKEVVNSKFWTDHIRKHHNYLTWKEGQQELNFKNEQAIIGHLQKISNKKGTLICNCGYKHKFAKMYLTHIMTCSVKVAQKSPERISLTRDSDTDVQCGVCQIYVDSKNWIDHIQKKHNYLAWKTGDIPLNFDDHREVLKHLKSIVMEHKDLICAKCGATRKYAKSYLSHLNKCERMDEDDSSDGDDTTLDSSQLVKLSHNESSKDLHESTTDCNTTILDSCQLNSNETELKDSNRPRRSKRAHPETIDDSRMTGDDTLDSSQLDCSNTDLSLPETSKRARLEPMSSDLEDNESLLPLSKRKSIICGVCAQSCVRKDWAKHIQMEHHYLAWRDGEPPLDLKNEKCIYKHLYTLSKKLDGLACSKCNFRHKYVKCYLEHTRECNEKDPLNSNDPVLTESNEESTTSSIKTQSKLVKCGVCQKNIRSKLWIKHLRKTHKYLAWKEGERDVNFEDNAELNQHLNKLIETLGELICYKCESVQKHVDSYLEHIKNCKKMIEIEAVKEHEVKIEVKDDPDTGPINDNIVKCGVCNKELQESLWIGHIENEHNYLAWKDGETKLDLCDEEAVRLHLYVLSKKLGGLICAKCKVVRRYVKSYLEHIKSCGRTSIEISVDVTVENCTEPIDDTEDKIVNCGVCKQEMRKSHWIEHIAEKHNYVAWINGESVLDFKNEMVVRQHLQQLSNQLNGLVCSKCKSVRKNARKFLLHMDICDGTLSEASSSKQLIKCGVCGLEMENDTWYRHTEKNHNYLARTDGEIPLNFENAEEVRDHLRQVCSKLGGLVCSKCDHVHKRVKKFLEHINICDGTNPMKSDDREEKSDNIVKCGVCALEMTIDLWNTHAESHNYLAWIDGKPPLDLNDEESIRNHLCNRSKALGGLSCSKCGTKRKYVKSYLEHVKQCTYVVEDEDKDGNNINSLVLKDSNDLSVLKTTIKCGVCSKEVQVSQWIKHTQITHNYIAWKDGEDPIDLQNDVSVLNHLSKVQKLVKTLMCPYCGITKRNVGRYHDHMKNCNAQGEVCEDKITLLSKNDGMYECGICHEKIIPAKWNKHAMDKHYNVAWVVGEIPINLKNPYGIEKCLKKYIERTGKMVCNNCGAKRASLMGFFVHVITCGKTDEETEIYKEECGICHKLYFGVYRHQHMLTHRTQQCLNIVKEEKNDESNDSIIVTGRRKAAEKATRVIETYKKNAYDKTYDFKCENCDFGCDTNTEFSSHKCNMDTEDDLESDIDIASSCSSEDYVSSDISEESVETERKPKTMRRSLKYKPIKGNPYLKNTITDFRSLHFSEENLFIEWITPSYDYIDCEDTIKKYLPKLEQSCQVNINGEWLTYSRFEGKHQTDVYSMFVGGSIQCISWAPHNYKVNTLENNYLAVVTHIGSDLPRCHRDELLQHSGLIQIWDMCNFHSVTPKLALGLVHDYGTVWAMDWCHSGAREIFDPNSEEKGPVSRLGLLAIACSNGSAYIFCVPNPKSMPKSGENLFLKLKPVAELRFTMKSNNRVYQATSLSWSKKQGHAVVAVGYADGRIALFDLKNTSPLLRSSEKDLTVFYPYHDERLLNSSISALDMFPSWGEFVPDAVCGASSVGALTIPVAGGRRLMSRLPSSYVAFTPAWPVAVVGGDEGLVSQSPYDIEWHGCGRKLGSLRAGAGCYHCGCVLIYSPPLLRRAPLYSDLDKTVVATVHLTKLNLKEEDESSKVEPIKYEDAIKKYGVEFTISRANFKPSTYSKEPYPERFPLAEVTSLAYCTSGKYHDIAAVATHAGLIFIFKAQ